MNNLLPFFTAGEIAETTKGNLVRGLKEKIFRGLSTDSRNIEEGNLFIPIVGENYDGHDFIEMAVKGGAAGIMIQRGKSENFELDIPLIIVDDTLKSLGDIASFWRRRFDVPVVAVTGSSGKTTTKEMLASVLSLSRNILKNYGSFNNLVGLPLTLLRLNASHEAAILEMGTNVRGEIGRLTQIADPDIGIITNIGPAHLEGLKSLNGVAEEKGDLFLNMKEGGVAIINRDDDAVRTLRDRWVGKSVTFGIEGDPLVRAENIIKSGERETSFVLAIEGTRKKINIEALGRHNVYNALAAAACSWELDIGYDQICHGLENFKQLPGRMSKHKLKNGAYLIDDTYNANPASTMEAIETVNDLKGDNDIVVIMGDMLELGDQAREMHEEVGQFMAERNVSRIFLKGDLVRSLAAGAERGGLSKDRIIFPATPELVVAELSSSLRKGDWILAKGSRRMRMEEYVKAIIKVFEED